jgi:hypothetical protein
MTYLLYGIGIQKMYTLECSENFTLSRRTWSGHRHIVIESVMIIGRGLL